MLLTLLLILLLLLLMALTVNLLSRTDDIEDKIEAHRMLQLMGYKSIWIFGN